jgi:hypothetical protein
MRSKIVENNFSISLAIRITIAGRPFKYENQTTRKKYGVFAKVNIIECPYDRQ